MSEKILKVALVGGTHGNELTGVRLVEQIQRSKDVPKHSFELKTLLANNLAIKADRRYLEKDLNRCFTQEQLNSPQDESLENKRAKEIRAFLGARNSTQAQDLIIDVHNTTANMQACMIFGALDEFMKAFLAHLVNKTPEVHLYYMPEIDRDNSPYLPSLAKRDLCVEMGPQAHGTLRGDLYELTQDLVKSAFQFINEWNTDQIDHTPQKVTVFEHLYNIDYPRNESGEITAYIHPDLQFKDYQEITKGSPLFRTFEGEDIFWEKEESVWPVFINEHAYYEKGLAMSLTIKKEMLF